MKPSVTKSAPEYPGVQKLIMKVLILILACFETALSARQCCKDGEILMPRGKCGTESMTTLNCTNGKLLLRDIILKGDKVSTQDTPGYVFVEDTSQYCVGEMYRNASMPEKGTIDVAIVCFEKISQSGVSDIETSGILEIISVFFLLLTFVVYTYLPQLRDLQGMCYMCLCISMALGFLSLGILQLSPGFTDSICTVMGFLVYIWMMATFFWMNVICINMFRTVQDATYLKKTERKQYFIYSCYAWGATLLLLTISLITNFVEGDHYKPGIGTYSCWFSGRTETWIFFYGPIAVLITANVALFVLSSLNLWQKTKKYEVNKLNNLKHKKQSVQSKAMESLLDLDENEKKTVDYLEGKQVMPTEHAELQNVAPTFLLSLKLFLVMGITWIFEIASFAHGQSHIVWKIMDIFNGLQGVIIFLLLVVLRKRAIQGLADENCCLIVTRPLAEKLNPNDDSDDQHMLADETVEVRLN